MPGVQELYFKSCIHIHLVVIEKIEGIHAHIQNDQKQTLFFKSLNKNSAYSYVTARIVNFSRFKLSEK